MRLLICLVSGVILFSVSLYSPVATATYGHFQGAPQCDNAHASPNVLWPPKHHFKAVKIKGLGHGTDVQIQCIRQDEPLNDRGDGNTDIDGDGIGGSIAYVRAERKRRGNGRVYHIDYTASNSYGQCSGTVKVGVPARKHKSVTDDGPLYISVDDPALCGGGPINQPPVIDSDPIERVRLGDVYYYDVDATDPEDDEITYSLSKAPEGMVIDSTTGVIQWTPLEAQLGHHRIKVVAADSEGGSNIQSFKLKVRPPVNHKPIITSEPIYQVPTGQLYTYAVIAEDPDGDALSYYLDLAPTGMVIDPLSGVITWTPEYNQIACYFVIVRVEDGRGGVAKQTFGVTVPFGNALPMITSEPIPQAQLGEQYEYQVVAEDPNGDTLTYSLNDAPVGMVIDSATGLITWDPSIDQQGDHPVAIRVEDARSAAVGQAFTVTVVVPNRNPEITSAPTLTGNVGEVYTYNVIANDADGDTLTYALADAPQGMTINENTGVITWTPTATQIGEAEINIVVTDGEEGSASQSYTLTIFQANRAPSITSAAITSVNENAPYTYDVEATDADGDTLIYSLTVSPQGMTIDEATGLIQWTPSAANIGEYTVTVSVADPEGLSDTQSFTVTVSNVNDAPVVNPVAITIDEDNSSTITLQGSDADNDNLTFAIISQPTNGQLTGTLPTVSYTPNANFNGTDTFSYRVNDGTIDSNIATVSITVNAANDAPTADNVNVQTSEDTATTITLIGNDLDGDNIAYAVVTQPQNGTLSGTAPSITYTPTTDFNGSDSFTYRVNDGQVDSAIATVSIIVDNANDAPVAENITAQTNEDTATVITLIANDQDGDGLTYEVVSQPANGTLSGAAPDLTYTPNADENGSDTFTYRVNDGTIDSNVATVSITVNAANDVPTADNVNAQTNEDTATTITLIGNDLDGDNIAYAVVTQPQNGALSGTAPSLTYTPNTDFNGSDSFTYRVNDGQVDSAIATVSITIDSTNDTPTAENIAAQTDEDVETNITLIANDLDGDALFYEVVSQPASGLLSGTAPDLTYTPNADFNGSDSFSYRVNDGTLNSNSATASITINPTNDAPTSENIAIQAAEDTATTITLLGNDIDGDSLTYNIVSQPINGVLSGIAPNLTYTPNSNFNGSDSFTYHVNDGTVDSAMATVSITIDNANDAPIVDNITAQTDEDVATNITLVGNDLDGDALTYEVLSQPANGTLSGTDPNLTYTPNADFNGTDSFTYRANDGVANSNTATTSIIVNSVNDTPIANDQSVITDEDAAMTITLTGSDPENAFLAYTIVSQPVSGQLSGSGFDYIYTPNADFSGADSFTFTVTDGALTSSLATVNILVSPVNDAPVAQTIDVQTNENTPLNITLVGSDNEMSPLTFSITTQPQSGILSGTAPNITYTPNTNFTGSDSFTYIANDGELNSETTTVNITVNFVNDAPSLTSIPVNFVVAGNTWRYTLEASDPEGDNLSYTIVSSPSGAVFDSVTNEVSWDTQGLLPGNYDFTFRVSDSANAFDEQSISVEVLSTERTNTHEGRDFWFPVSINQNEDDATYHIFVVSRHDNTRVIIDWPLLGINEQLNLTANEISTYNFSVEDVVNTGVLGKQTVLENAAAHVTSNNDITVYVMHQKQFTTDGFLVLPTNAISNQYIVGHYLALTSGSVSSNNRTANPIVGIVATEDDTQVVVKATMDIFPADYERLKLGNDFVISLNQGDVYNLEARGSHAADFTGTIVESDKPIAVFGEHACATVPDGVTACDHLIEQLPPIESLATDYFTVPFFGRGRNARGDEGDLIRVIAPNDNTDVYINGVLRTRLQSQEFFELFAGEPQHIQSSEPVLVVQFINSNGFDFGNDVPADPAMLIVPPAEQYLKSYLVNTPAYEIERNFVNIIMPTTAIALATVDGQPIDSTLFTPIENSDYSYAQMEIDVGSYLIEADQPFGVYSYGYAEFESYAYSGGMAFSLPNVVDQLSITSSMTSVVIGEQYCSVAEALDALGRPVNGVRIGFTVNGAHNDSAYALTNANGEAEFCYQGYQLGNDTVQASVSTLSSDLAIDWTAPLDNVAPVVTSIPNLKVVRGGVFTYQVQAIDPNGDDLSYRLIDPPFLMDIDQNGLIEWQRVIFSAPGSTAIGRNISVTIEVSDAQGATTLQRFALYDDTPFNNPPVFSVAEPNTQAVQGVPYVYNSAYSDFRISGYTFRLDAEDQRVLSPLKIDAVYAELSQAPADATITRDDWILPTGAKFDCVGCQQYLNWTPQAPGTYDFEIALNDSRGGNAAPQQFSVEVTPNLPPAILSTPPTIASVGNEYVYVIEIENDVPLGQYQNLDNLQIVFDQRPGAMRAELATSGVGVRKYFLRWTPAQSDLGEQAVSFYVTDRLGRSQSQTFTIQVIDNNQAPVITSTSIRTPEASILYSYQIVATDADNDPLTYQVLAGPNDMTVSNSGLVTWTPPIDSEGIVYSVWLSVNDGRGGIATQQYILNVQRFINRAPTIVPAYRPLTAQVGIEYVNQVQAIDRENDPITYVRHFRSTADTTVDDQGVLRWTPTETGTFRLGVRALDDANGGFDDEIWEVTVTDSAVPLGAELSLSPNVIDLGESSTLSVVPVNVVTTPEVLVSVDGVDITVDAQYQAEITPTRVGRIPVIVTIDDGQQNIVRETTLFVRDPADVTPPVVQIHSPISVTEISSPTDIIATVQDDNLVNVQLLYKRGTSPIDANTTLDEFTELYNGPNLFDNEVIATLDTTMLLNGTYQILLQATDSNGLVSGTASAVTVTGDLKVGNFSFTVEDLNIPLSGIPITVSRNYDSRRKDEALDFGYGWSIDYQSVRLEESREPTNGWNQVQGRGTFNVSGGTINAAATCIYPASEKGVTVTLPNGDTESFLARLSPTTNSPASLSDPNCYLTSDRNYNLYFIPEGDTQSVLQTNEGRALYLSDLSNGYLSPIGDGEPTAITNYTLTTRAGFVYRLNQDFGVEQIIDPNGNTITYSDSGIMHSNGTAIDFVRDGQNRITQVIDPAGNAINYAYNSNGDLLTVTERDGAVTTYSYFGSNCASASATADCHLLDDIVDPLGRRMVRNIYDSEGRLIAQEDQNGNRTEFNHNIEGRQSIVTDRNGNTTVMFYDDRGNVTSQVDALGNTRAYTFDGQDNQLSETDELGNTTTATFNEDNDQLTQVDALGNIITYVYNNLGQETEITDARGNQFINGYDNLGNLLAVTDPEGNIATVEILPGTFNLPGTVTDALGNATRYGYARNGLKGSETNALGHFRSWAYDDNSNLIAESLYSERNGTLISQTQYVYDSRNRVTQTTDALGNVTRTEYDLAGQEIARIDALGRRTEMDYDVYGNLLEMRYPDGTSESHTYDPENNRLSSTDRLGRTTTYEYDALNRQIRVNYAVQGCTSVPGAGCTGGTPEASTQTEYDAAGRVVAEIDERGNRTTFEYDAANRRTATIDALGNRHEFNYDADGNLIDETDARLNTTTYTYNSLDQRTQTTFADNSTQGEVFDALSRRTQMTDQAGRGTDYAYDALGRLTSVTDALGQITSYTYDEQGNKLTQTDAEGRTTTWTYDALGRALSRTLPLGQIEGYQYDANGNMTQKTDFNGAVHTYSYDVNDRLTQVDYADGSQETTGYDAVGNRTSATITDSNGTRNWRYTYDSRNRLTQETKPDGSVIEYSYDAAGNRTQLTVTVNGATQSITDYDYDALNRLTTTTARDSGNAGNAGVVTTYGYDAVGNRAAMNYANGTITQYTYDALNRLTELTTSGGLSGVLQRFTYTLDPTGRRTQIAEASGRVTDYVYDDLYRLTSETITDAANGNYTAQYTYDQVGNRTQSIIDGVTTAYTYDDNDRITQYGGTTYTYDENGNTLTETLDGVTKTYGYNSQNELVNAEEGGDTLTYQYNVDGIRTQQSAAGIATDYLVDHNRDYAQVLVESENGTEVVSYTYGDDLISQDRGGNTYQYHYDGLGSTRALSDATGTLTDTYNYEAFGETLNQTGSTLNNYLFTGEQFDQTLNQYYLRARYYDQGVGRFTQMDTWQGNNFDPVTLHKYLYVHADPVNNIDPSGNITIGQVVTAINVSVRLTTIATSTYDVFKLASGEGEVSAGELGLSIILSRVPGSSLARRLSRKYRDRTGRNLRIPCVKNSFVAGTLVHTRNGVIPIEDVQIGDYVLSYNEVTGEQEYQEVVHLIRHENEHELVNIEVANGESFLSTIEHPFYVDGQWKDAVSLSLSDLLTTANDNNFSIVNLVKFPKRSIVYNFTVANTHNYYIGKVGILVHNDNDCVLSVNNMGEFFNTPFGSGIKRISSKTSRQYDGASIYEVTKNSGSLKKGQHYYLDNLHKDHLEVYDKNGKFLRVLNLDGSENAAKTAAALGRSIKDVLK